MSGTFSSSPLINFASNLKLGPWAWGLQEASWRGLRFAVRSSNIRRGRKVVVHEYPFSDDVWVEDLGRGTRVVSFSGFLIGEDVFEQRDAMVAAAEVAGTGVLVHPSLGTLQASLIEFSAGERADLGRVVEIEFSFIQAKSQPAYPSDDLSTQLQVIAKAVQVAVASAQDFIGTVTTAFTGVNSAISFTSNAFASVKGIVLGFVSLATGAAADPGASASATNGLPGSYGRYAAGTRTTAQPPSATVASVIAQTTTARASVGTAGGQTAAVVDPTLLPGAAQSLTETVRNVAQNPSDQIRLLSGMAAYNPTITPGTAAIGAAIAAIQAAAVRLFRAAALISIGNATAAYQPQSYDEAIAVLQSVTALLDTEILAAADAGETATYLALRALRTAITNDLLSRAANLPRLVTITKQRALPSLKIAYDLYADATRSDELIGLANPPAPLFMPLQFRARTS